jgi:hypothetical protein
VSFPGLHGVEVQPRDLGEAIVKGYDVEVLPETNFFGCRRGRRRPASSVPTSICHAVWNALGALDVQIYPAEFGGSRFG